MKTSIPPLDTHPSARTAQPEPPRSGWTELAATALAVLATLAALIYSL